MKTKLLFIFLFIGVIAFGQSNHSITIDGTNDFNSVENLTTTTSGWTDYLTWDATDIYFGISGGDVDVDGKVSFIYIDTDPQSSTGTTSSLTWGGRTHTLPFNANWAFAYKVQAGADYWNLRKYNAGWQADQAFSGSVSLGTDFLEVKIPRTDIGSPSEIKITIFVQNDDGSWTWSATPNNTITDGSGDKTFAHYLGYTLDAGYNPNDDNALDYVMRKNIAFLSFDGSNDYVKYTDDATLKIMNGATDYTIEAWIYPQTGVQEYDRVLQRFNFFSVIMYDGNNDSSVEDWYFGVYDGSNWHYYNTEGDASLTLNEWNHIAVVNNSTDGSLKLFVNGTDVTTTGGYSNRTLRTTSNNYNLYIGQKGDASDYFKGYIDEVHLTNVAVTPTELHTSINDNAYYSNSNTAGLFHFDEGTGTSTENASSGVNAVLNNGVAWNTVVTDIPFETEEPPVPVELTSFSATSTSSATVVLNWETATEVNNYGFEVQRATADNFEKIGFVNGHGNSNSPNSYTFVDNSASGNTSYRLKQIDTDGSFEYSDVIEVNGANLDKVVFEQNYPNPFNPSTTFSFSIPNNEFVTLAIYNSLGQKVANIANENMNAGTYNFNWNATEMTSGVYFARLNVGTKTQIQKIMLLK